MEKSKPLHLLFGLALLAWFPELCAGSLPERDTPVRFRVDHAGRIILPVFVNGTGPYHFLLDTGSPLCKVDKSLSAALDLHPVSGVSLRTFTGASEGPIVRLGSLAVGRQAASDVLALHCDLERLFSLDARVQGIVGQNFLARRNYLISYRDKTMRFEEAGELKSELKGDRLQSRCDQGKFYVPVRTRSSAEPEVPFLLDSGSPYVLIFAEPAFNIPYDLLIMDPRDLEATTSIGRRRFRPCRLASLQVGGTVLRNVKAVLAPLLPGETRPQRGMLPLSVFDAVYFNNEESCVILNPRLGTIIK